MCATIQDSFLLLPFLAIKEFRLQLPQNLFICSVYSDGFVYFYGATLFISLGNRLASFTLDMPRKNDVILSNPIAKPP